MPRKGPPTPEEKAAGARMRALRERWGFGQKDISGNHTEASNVESGKNLLNGAALVAAYAKAFGVSSDDIRSLHAGNVAVEDLVKRSKKPPPKEAPAPPRRGRAAAPQAQTTEALTTLQKNVFGSLISEGINMDRPTAERWSEAIVYALRGGEKLPSATYIALRLRDLAAELDAAADEAEGGAPVVDLEKIPRNVKQKRPRKTAP